MKTALILALLAVLAACGGGDIDEQKCHDEVDNRGIRIEVCE